MNSADPVAAEPYRILRSRLDLSAPAYAEAGPGAIWLVGCGPDALFEIMARQLFEIMARQVEPALAIGVPVGFAGAAEAKDAWRRSGWPALSNVSEKGGPAVAVAAFEALPRIAKNPGEEAHG